MIRSIAGVIILVMAVLWLPLWVQIVLFAVAVILLPYRLFLLIPAIIGDALYMPGMRFSFTAHWLTLTVLAMIGIHWYVMKKVRVQHLT